MVTVTIVVPHSYSICGFLSIFTAVNVNAYMDIAANNIYDMLLCKAVEISCWNGPDDERSL